MTFLYTSRSGLPTIKTTDLLGDLVRSFRYENRTIKIVQVGVNDALIDDFVRITAIENSWEVLLIEPHPQYILQAQKNYSSEGAAYRRARWEQVAVLADEGYRTLYYVENAVAYDEWAPGIASFRREHLEEHGIALEDVGELLVQHLPLSKILDRNDYNDADILVVDVEGFENEVLRSIDFTKFRPRLIVLETTHMSRDEWRDTKALVPGEYRDIYHPWFTDSAFYLDH